MTHNSGLLIGWHFYEFRKSRFEEKLVKTTEPCLQINRLFFFLTVGMVLEIWHKTEDKKNGTRIWPVAGTFLKTSEIGLV